MELNKQIRKYRSVLKLSQEELADKIYVTRQSISNWETGKNYPDIHSLILMSTLFEITLDQLIKGDLEMMKKEIKTEDIMEMEKQGKVFFVLLALTVLSIAPLYFYLKLYGFIIWGAIALFSILYSLKLEKFKKENDIQTYKEIVSFLNGERLDEISEYREQGKRLYQIILKCVLGAVVGFFTAYGMLMIFSYFNK